MGRTLEMFEKTRQARQWLMHVCDAGDGPCSCDYTPISVRYSCARCGHETGWMGARTVTDAKRGIPCPLCNNDEFKKLYLAVGEMMDALGCHGEISARDDRVQAVMDALYGIDGGRRLPSNC